MSHERRSQPRIDRELDARLLLPEGGLLDPHATVASLSELGFELHSRVRLAKGALVAVTMDLPGHGSVRCNAELVWVEPSGGRLKAGARIVKMPRENARRLRLFLNPGAFDYHRGMRQAALGLLCGLLAVAAEDVIRHRPLLLEVLAGLIPKALMLGVMGLAVVAAFRHKRH